GTSARHPAGKGTSFFCHIYISRTGHTLFQIAEFATQSHGAGTRYGSIAHFSSAVVYLHAAGAINVGHEGAAGQGFDSRLTIPVYIDSRLFQSFQGIGRKSR